MKKILSFLTILTLLLTNALICYADQPQTNAVYELFSADGIYTDSVGNEYAYSFHVPQLYADSADASEINKEIEESFGRRVENQFSYMEGRHSISCWNTEWHAYWTGSQLFLLLSAEESGDLHHYGAYGYDFETGSKVTNDMILEQMGISEEEYLQNLKEKVQELYERIHSSIPEDLRVKSDYYELLEKTLEWQTMEQPMFINQFGEIETISMVGEMAGAGRDYYLVTVGKSS